MNRFQLVATGLGWVAYLIVGPPSLAQPSGEPSILPLTDLEAFQPAGEAWQIAGNAEGNRSRSGGLSTEPGTGILVYDPEAGDGGDLSTDLEHGDLRLELDYMMSRGAVTGLLLQGRYEIQLADSWGVRKLRVSDNGGIARRAKAGLHPRRNPSRAPGLWQHLEIAFQAPRFDEQGEKIENAVIKRVTVNGVVVQEEVEMQRASHTALAEAAAPEGPLVFQEASAPVAFRNIQLSQSDSAAVVPEADPPPPEPIFVEVTDRSRILRAYVDHRGEKKLSGVFVGDPSGIHYAVDLAQGSLLQAWKGEFLDAGTVWRERGMEPNSRKLDEPEPLGSPIVFSGAPDLALLDTRATVWPDTVDSRYRFKGYSVDSNGRPTFRYSLDDIEVTDEFVPGEEGRTLARRLTFESRSGDGTVWTRLAEASTITRSREDTYRIGDNAYFIEEIETLAGTPEIRQQDGRAELLVPVSVEEESATLEYSIIW